MLFASAVSSCSVLYAFNMKEMSKDSCVPALGLNAENTRYGVNASIPFSKML
jgi:hypothetical protein